MKKLFYIVMLFTLLLSACGKDTQPKEVAVDKDTSVNDIVGAIVKNKYNVKEEDKGIVTISIQDTDVREGLKSQMLKDSTKIFAEISKLKSVKTPSIVWSAPLAEPNGKEEMTEVLSIYFNEEDFKEVNWANYNQLNIESIATQYKEHDALED
ncbi:hypothetical protein [Lysinibacillus sphaericus]|uniref:Lipoprotein n=1 Tax=Lysinibacillus sphaericus OT4b.31 TaxID=1285586 RepID=R7ZI67_LYSSH|nr:hypothetical protein [Lysinibacillus sphaericus]EON73751.1 hypothetical protein H131_03779 [Lysinibacillus sphaericus OT4b.31]